MTWLEFREQTLDELGKRNALSGATDFSGRTLPLSSPLDLLAMLGMIEQGVESAIVRINALGRAIPVSGGEGAQLLDGPDVAIYLAGLPKSIDQAWIRRVSKVTTGSAPWDGTESQMDFFQRYLWGAQAPAEIETTEIAFYEPIAGDRNQADLEFLHGALREWQACINSVGNAIRSNPLSILPIGGYLDVATTQGYWNAIQRLCASLDVMQESPPRDLWDDVPAALDHALQRSSEAAGKLAARVGDTAGRTGASFLDGFLGNATMTTLVVTAIVVYVVVLR